MSIDSGLCPLKRTPLKLLCFLTVCCTIAAPAFACTIFVLTDGARTLFFNNEDWLNPSTRIWFAPAATGRYSCAYVGFDDGWPQGGLNTKGVAFDWVAGYMEEWRPDPSMKSVTGNPSERMLGTCATVEDAISFYRQYWEPGFSRAKILIADSSGASAIIGAEGGKLRIERSKQSRGFGFCGQKLQRLLAKPPEPTVPNGAAILRGCLQTGETATKYSNVFDLQTGDIFLFDQPEIGESVKLNLAEELAKGGHYYDIPKIRQQLTKPPMQLLRNMKRLSLSQVHPIPDKEPGVTNRFRTILQNALLGTVRAEDYTTEFWKGFSSKQGEFQADLKQLGSLLSMTLVDRWNEKGQRNYLYRTEFQKATFLQHYVLDGQNRIALIQSDDIEPKPAARR